MWGGLLKTFMGKFVVIAAWGSDNSWVNSRLTKETWEERLGNEILWRALESSDIFLGIYKLLSCSGLCICSEKTQESLRVPLLTDLEEVCKREVKAIIRHGCKLPSWVLKGCPNTHTHAHTHTHTHTHRAHLQRLSDFWFQMYKKICSILSWPSS